MAPATATTVRASLDDGELQRAWQGADAGGPAPAAPIHRAQLTISRNTGSDFQDRQVYLFVDDEPWGKVKYGRPMTREIACAAAVQQRHAHGRLADDDLPARHGFKSEAGKGMSAWCAYGA